MSQKDTTRLGMEWEWVTQVSVVKEGQFTRSGLEEVDEAEIFKGDENTLMMIQTYTEEFQCQYMLQRYPFDTQAKLLVFNNFKCSQACAIKMDRGSQSAKTVLLLAQKVFYTLFSSRRFSLRQCNAMPEHSCYAPLRRPYENWPKVARQQKPICTITDLFIPALFL